MLPLLAAPFIGSVLGVLIRRLPRDEPVAMARSRCDHCRRTLAPIDLVPIVSYAALGGRCRTCRAPIGRFHPTIEILAVLVVLWVATQVTGARLIWADCGLGWVLLALGWIDAEFMILPDVLTLPLIVAGLAVTWVLEPQTLAGHAAAAMVGYGVFRLIDVGYRALRGRDGLGAGDAKLLAAAGAWIGFAGLPHLLIGAGLLGIAAILFLRARDGRALSQPVAFGPALALAFFVTRLYG